MQAALVAVGRYSSPTRCRGRYRGAPLRPDAAGRYSAPKRCRKDSASSCAACCASLGATLDSERPPGAQLHVPRLAADSESRRGLQSPFAPDRFPLGRPQSPNARLQVQPIQNRRSRIAAWCCVATASCCSLRLAPAGALPPQAREVAAWLQLRNQLLERAG